MMKFLRSVTEMFADQGSGHAAEDSKSKDGKRKFVVTIKRGDGTEIEKNVKAFSIGDIKHHFGKDFVDAELHPDEMGDEEEDDDRTADEQMADGDLEESMLMSVIAEANLGSRVEFPNYKMWKAALPAKSTMHKDGKLERAQSRSKDFEGVSGTWDSEKNEGWIYAHYLKKENLVEDEMKFPAGLSAEEKFAYRKGWQNPGDTPEDWEFKSSSIQGKAFRRGQKDHAETLEEAKDGLSRLQEMAKRSKPDDFYAMAKKKYGAEKVKSLKWPEIVAVAKENDVLIPPYLRSQKVGRGSFNLVPPDHADTKAAPKEEPKAAPKEEPKKEAPKAEPAKEEPKKEYKMPQLENVSYDDWSEFYGKMKKRFGEFSLERIEHGRQTRDRYGTMLGPKLMVDSKTGTVMGMWDVTGSDKVPGRGFTAYGQGYLAKEKQEEPKAAPKPVEKRKGGSASEAEMKTALLDAASEMKHHKNGRGADWRTSPEKNGKGFDIAVRYWGHWEGDDGSGDYDFQNLSQESSKEIASILNQVEKRHKNVAMSFQTGEKNWIYIRAE